MGMNLFQPNAGGIASMIAYIQVPFKTKNLKKIVLLYCNCGICFLVVFLTFKVKNDENTIVLKKRSWRESYR